MFIGPNIHSLGLFTRLKEGDNLPLDLHDECTPFIILSYKSCLYVNESKKMVKKVIKNIKKSFLIVYINDFEGYH